MLVDHLVRDAEHFGHFDLGVVAAILDAVAKLDDIGLLVGEVLHGRAGELCVLVARCTDLGALCGQLLKVIGDNLMDLLARRAEATRQRIALWVVKLVVHYVPQ